MDATLEGTYNFRDLGGLPLRGGGRTATGVLFRSDALHTLTPHGVDQLAASPIGTVIDLRTPMERRTAHDRMPHGHRIHEKHLPLLDGALAQLAESALAARVLGDRTAVGRAASEAMTHLPTLAELYEGMLRDGAASFAEVARLVAAPGDEGTDGVLVHCTAGKDRTGVAIAMLLDAVGVEREAIVADYALTQENLAGPWFDRMAGMVTSMGIEMSPELAELIGGSPETAIESALDRLDAQGGARSYLRSGGLTDAELASLDARLSG